VFSNQNKIKLVIIISIPLPRFNLLRSNSSSWHGCR